MYLASYCNNKCQMLELKFIKIPDICDDDNMFTISLVTIQVWIANFNAHIIESVVFHFSRMKLAIASVMRLCPVNNGPGINN